MPKRTAPAQPRPIKSKVFWSEAEQELIISRAVAIQKERPELSGLPLLREAQFALPVDRRRKVTAITQANWFNPGVKDALRRQKDAEQTEKIPKPIVHAPNDPMIRLVAHFAELVEELKNHHVKWEERNRREHEEIHEELRKQTELFTEQAELMRSLVDSQPSAVDPPPSKKKPIAREA